MLHTLPLGPKGYGLRTGLEREEGIAVQIPQEYLGESGGNTQQIVDGTLQPVEVSRGNTPHGSGAQSRQGEAGRRARTARQGNRRSQTGAADIASLVIVLVHADVGSKSHHMRPCEVADVVHNLRGIHGAVGVGISRVVHGRVIEGKARRVGEKRIRLALREQKLPARKAQSQLVDNTRRQSAAEAEGDVSGRTKYLAAGGVAGKNLRTAVERIAIQSVLFAQKHAEKDRVLLVDGVVEPDQHLWTLHSERGIPLVSPQVQAISGVERIRCRIATEYAFHRGVKANLPRIVRENIVRCHTVRLVAIGTVVDSPNVLAGPGVNKKGTILRNPLAGYHERILGIGQPVAIHTRQCGRSIQVDWRSKILIDGIREVCFLGLPAYEEERPVLADGSAEFEPVLIQLDDRLWAALGARVKFLGVESSVSEKLGHRAVELVCTGARRDRNVRSGVAAFFGRRVRRGDLELLHVIWSQPEDVAGRIRVGRLIGLNAVNRDVHRRGPGAIHVHRVTRTLHHSRLIHDQVEGVASIQRQRRNRLLLDHITDSRIGCLEKLRRSTHFDALGGSAYLEHNINVCWGIDQNPVIGAIERFEADCFHP